MGFAIVKIKVMPVSPDINLDELESKLKSLLESQAEGDKKIEKQPIAFGLNAIILTFVWPEEKELEKLEEDIKNIEGVNSAEVIDMRRAIG